MPQFSGSPGVESARAGHHFAYRGNNFYKMIYGAGSLLLSSALLPYLTVSIGFTERVISAIEDVTLPERYNIGVVRMLWCLKRKHTYGYLTD